jgi:MEMO1 family protein
LKNDPDELLSTIKSNEGKKISELATSLCGWTSVLTLLNMTKGDTSLHFSKIQYMNSGDSKYSDSSRVVGYNAIVVFGPENDGGSGFSLTEKDKNDLLEIARKTIVSYVGEKKNPDIDTSKLGENIKKQCGAFVTLHKDGKLRGCIGRFTADIPLYDVVRDMAISSSTQDYRFSPVTKDEIAGLEIEISVLSPMEKIKSIDEIELGKHGIYIIKGGRGGTFLPQVATETGWTKEEFLGHCAQDKAGIGWNGWKDSDIYIYTAIVFSEKDFVGK